MNTETQIFLPKFCDGYTVFISIIVTELLAFALVLTPLNYDWESIKKDILSDLAMLSLFMQWLTLVSLGVLCMARRWLSRLSNDIIVAIISYLLILIVTLVISEAAWQLNMLVLVTEPTNIKEHQFFLLRNLALSAIFSAIALRYFYIQHQWKKEMEALASTRAEALQARIRPHFLFNCMNTIASLIRFKPSVAEEVVIEFADLFRASLAEGKTYITFKEEQKLCQEYLHIETLRLGERLQIIWQVDDIPEDAILPPLIMQPVLENAVYHGIQPLAEGGLIKILGKFNGKQITLYVENPLFDTVSPHQGNSIAQKNIQQRLLIFYGTQANFSVQKHANTYHVIFSFPYKTQYNENTDSR
jgi:two-component system sensor histidine kinase AlgZ